MLFGLTMEREQLYERIERRVEAIVAAGAEDEVRRGRSRRPSHTARKALGFDELLAGDVERAEAAHRNYARRQITWMRKMPTVQRLDVTELTPGRAADAIVRLLDGA